MKKFLAIYTGYGNSEQQQEWNEMDEAKRNEIEQKAMVAWGDWMEKNKDSIVDQGGPLSKTKLADKKGISDTQNNMAAYVMVQAESREAAAELFRNHPHFALFPGEGVEIMEVMPMPGM